MQKDEAQKLKQISNSCKGCFYKKMMTTKVLLAFCCACLFSACNYHTEDLTINPYATGSAGKQVDPNCTDNYERPEGGGYLSSQSIGWRHHVDDCKSRGQGQKLSY